MTYKGIGECRAITLTVGADTLSPNSAVAASKTTSGDDLIRGVIDNSLETIDSIDGGEGTDTIRANVSATGTAAAAAAATPATVTTSIQPVLANVEKVFINATVTGGKGSDTTDGVNGGAAAVAFSAKDSTGINELWSEGSTLTAGAAGTGATAATAGGAASLAFNDINLATTVGLKDTTANTTFAFASATGAADEATLALSKATGALTATINSVETINVVSTGGANSITLAADTVETINISGDKGLTFAFSSAAAASAQLKTIDASAATGALTLNHPAAAASNSLTVTAGQGADTINLNGATGKAHTINGQAGNDTIVVAADKAHTLTGGDGNDTFRIVEGAGGAAFALDASTAAKLDGSAIKVTDWSVGSNKLTFATGVTLDAGVTGTIQSNASTAANLKAAVEVVAAAMGTGNTVAAFDYGSDTYVFVDRDGNATINAGDGLVKLTGVNVAADLTAADFGL